MILRGLAGIALAVAALAVLSLYRETLGFPISYLALLTTMLFWVTQATSWNILSGYSGYFSFGQAAYVGVGAYTTAVLFGRHQVDFYLTVVIAAALCALLALGMGFVAFRLRSLRGEIFALLTLAVPFILAALARINNAIDGGQGVVVGIPPFPAQLGLLQDFLYLASLIVAGVAVAVAFVMAHTRSGRALASIRDAEDVAEALGVGTFRYKLQALVASAVIGGVGGSVFALQIGFVTVESVFNLTVPLFVIVMSVLGGRTHWSGPLIGAVLVVLLQDRLTALGLTGWPLIVLGAVLVVLVVVAPDGLYVRLRNQWPGTLIAFGLVTAALWAGGIEEPLDAILIGMLTGTAVALSPLRRRARAEAPSRAEPVPSTKDELPSPVDAAGAVLVECRNLTRHFGGVRAVVDLTLEIREGELVGLVGPNGSGKTTLVNLLAGSLRPTSGRILIAGHDTTTLPPHRIAHAGVARTYQIPRPFASMTVRDNVAMAVMFGRVPRQLAHARRVAAEHLAVVELDHLADAYPSALNLHQRQLLEMARALATAPKVLLLDEALAGLNPAEIDNAVAVIRRIHANGVSIVIVEHLLRVVKALSTRVVVLDRGSCLADGDPKTVLADPAVVAAYLGRRAHA
ncbi:MAG: ATP-binding cassette domain-containing protein [Actinophytocola sp.]|uniref:branched-chain amino acid ABC transporter ATP-binding protein/permease n=1 Tax=Actinophytocola sp. TaxID=1872138 RepID=UPI003D6B7B5D